MADRFDKFTERARKVLTLAQEEAQRFNHNYIGTEHLLLGLVREGDGVAARVLTNLGVELPKVRSRRRVHHRPRRPHRHGRDRADAARQEGDRAGRRRGAPPEPSLHRHRAPAARPGARGRGHRRRRAREPGRQPREGAHPGHRRSSSQPAASSTAQEPAGRQQDALRGRARHRPDRGGAQRASSTR